MISPLLLPLTLEKQFPTSTNSVQVAALAKRTHSIAIASCDLRPLGSVWQVAIPCLGVTGGCFSEHPSSPQPAKRDRSAENCAFRLMLCGSLTLCDSVCLATASRQLQEWLRRSKRYIVGGVVTDCILVRWGRVALYLLDFLPHLVYNVWHLVKDIRARSFVWWWSAVPVPSYFDSLAHAAQLLVTICMLLLWLKDTESSWKQHGKWPFFLWNTEIAANHFNKG